MSSIFNEFYNKNLNFEPVNLYNWDIEFILDDDSYEYMNSREYLDFSAILSKEYFYRNYSWQEQSDILTFMCKKCNLPKKKINEVNTYCMGMKASFNAGINIDSSLSLSFDESSNRIVSRILTNLSNLYSTTDYIYKSSNNDDIRYAALNKVSLSNRKGIMVGGSKSDNFREYLNDDNLYVEDGRFVGRANANNRDLTIKVKMYHNKYGYLRPNEYLNNNESKEEKPIQEFVFYKCFINNLNYGSDYDYGSEDNVSIDCEIMYNWYTTSNIREDGKGELDILESYKKLVRSK